MSLCRFSVPLLLRPRLCFEAYLPPDLAAWLLDLIERGVFSDPSEAVFVILGEHRDLEPHADLRRELLLSRSCQAAIDDPRPSLTGDEVEKHFRNWPPLSCRSLPYGGKRHDRRHHHQAADRD